MQLDQIKLLTIAQQGHTPAVSYSGVTPNQECEGDFVKTSLAVGSKNIASPSPVNNETQFPASSLSKVVFAYLVLTLADKNQIHLDEPLHRIMANERFIVDSQYPEKAIKLTARHILSHTTGLPNFGENTESTLEFNDACELGHGYSYSGEAFYYLQQVLQAKTGKTLEELAKEHVFTPLGMTNSTFLPAEVNQDNVATVHTSLNEPTSTYVDDNRPCNAAGSLMTTGADYSLFLSAWLEKIENKGSVFADAFELPLENETRKCGLGWHIDKNEERTIAYQYGENPNTRAFAAINLTEKKAAAFFTNSENGMSIANQVFTTPEFIQIGNMTHLYEQLNYAQSTEPGWQETLSGKISEAKGDYEEARASFQKAISSAPNDSSKIRRLEWFNTTQENLKEQNFTAQTNDFPATFTNPYNDEIELAMNEGGVIFKQYGQKIPLIKVSDTDFLPIHDQSMKISLNNDQMSIQYVEGFEKSLVRQATFDVQHASSSAAMLNLMTTTHPAHVEPPESILQENYLEQRTVSTEEIKRGKETENEYGKIVLLCGTSTAGKTSICDAAQDHANNTGNSWNIDGTDIAMDEAWEKESTLDGVKYKSGQEHFIDAMKMHDIDDKTVDRAAKVIDRRTLAIAVLSRQSLGKTKVDTVNLIPGEDLRVQAQEIHKKLSSENNKKYSTDDIEDLLSIIKTCNKKGDFFARHPHIPLKNLYQNMLSNAINEAKKGRSTILDVVGNEMINGQLIADEFKKRLKKSELPDNSGQVVVAHCPINTLIRRIDGRNAKAKEDGNEKDIRQAFFPFTQYGAIYERTEDPLDPSKLAVGKVSRQDIIDAAAKFGGGDSEVSSLLDSLGFKDEDEEVYVTSKVSSDQYYQTGAHTSEQIAESLCEKAFGHETPSEDIQNDEDLRSNCSL